MRAASKSREVTKILVRPALWICACHLLAAALSAQCTSPTPVPDGAYTSGDHSQVANNALSAVNFVISGSATATFVAGNCIQLLPGFHATAGTAATTFHAWVETAPSAVSASPTNSAGLNQSFTWTVSSPSGYTNLSEILALFNTSISGANACYLLYSRASNLLYLADNAGANWSSGIVPGSSGSASNSQCSINGSGASVSGSGTQLSLTVPIAFQTSFSGTQNQYLYALDNAGLNTEWQTMGAWTVPPPPPGSFTLSAPPNGSANQATSLTLSWTLSSGATSYDVYLGASSPPAFAGNVSAASYSATGLNPGDLYFWTVVARNGSASTPAPAVWTFTTAPPLVTGNTLDGRRTGVKSTGSYWGAAGEQIDLLTGNLNYSIPLIHAKGPGSAATFALSYNSQIWRQNGGTPTLLGRDTGVGLGWTLQAGSLVAVSNSYYLFTDSTGAQYTLDQNNNAVWTSRDGTYAAYDSTAHRLYFPDGSFWNMTVQSVAPELDAGTLYPQSIQDSNGDSIQIQYGAAVGATQANTSGRITQITDPRGSHWLTYTYLNPGDAFPHLTSVSDSTGSGESYSFTYGWSLPLSSPFAPAPFGAATVLQKITVSGLNTSYTLQYGLGTGELTQAATPLGGALAWAYRTYTYGSGLSYREVQTRQMSSSPGATYSWNVVLDNNPTLHATATVSDVAAASKKVWTFNTTGQATAYEEGPAAGAALLHKDYTWTTDFAGNPYVGSVVTTQNPGANQVQSKSTQALDIAGNVTNSQAFAYGNLNTPARTYNYTYLSSANYTSRYVRNRMTQVTVTDSNGTTTLATNTYDAYTGCTMSGMTPRTGLAYHDDTNYGPSFLYRGNVTSAQSLGSSTCTDYETTGVAVAWMDGAGHTLTSAPAASSNYSLPGTLTPGGNSGLATTVTYFSSWAVTSVSGPNGATGSTTYDGNGMPLTNTIPDGAVTNYTYAFTGVNGATANQQTATLGSGAGARWKRTTMDGFGRMTRVETGHDSTTVSQADTQYAPCACSPLGKLWRTSQPYAPGGTPAWTTNAYDASGRTISVTAPDGSVTIYAYSGNQTTVTDPAGKWKTSVTDAFGNLIQVIEPNPGGGANLVTNYTYNNLNQLTDVTMPRSNGTQTRTFVYTGADMTSATNPENGTVTYQYDTSHRITQRTDNIGQQTRYIYDPYGRLTQVQHWKLVTWWQNGQQWSQMQEDPTQQVNYSYDTNPLDPNYSQNTWGRLAAVQFHDSTGSGSPLTYQYSYNQAGRVLNQRMTYPSVALDMTASYTWDTEGRMTSLAYPLNGPVFNYAFDAMGRLNTMTSGGTTVSSATYGVAGELLNLTYDGYSETRTYNSLFQLTQMTSTLGMNLQYIYPTGQNNGRITTAIDGVSNETVNYTYDPLNRLATAAAGGWSQSFTYDGFGNLTGKTGTGTASATGLSASFDPLTNHQIGGSYDGNGNNSSPGGVAGARYDVENRMVSQNTTSYTYDPKGKRVAKVVYNANGDTTDQEVYFYDIGGRKLTTVQCTQNADSSWSYSPTTNIYFGGKLIRSNGVTVATDRLGSVRANHLGERMSYYPYGEEKTSTADGREKFGTYFRDSATQDYADQRYYNAGTGRFNTPDPYQASGGTGAPWSWNRYAYVGGDPVNFKDPGGNRRVCTGPPDDQTCEDEPDDPFGPDPQRGPKQGTPKGTDPPLVTPSLGGTASASQKKLFTNAARAAESKLRKSGSPCAGDFGADALKIFDSATYTAGFSFATDDNGNPTAKVDPNIYATTDPASQSVTINEVGYFFDISPTPIQGTPYVAQHDMGTGLSQTNFDAFVLLHELGHLTFVLGDDRGKNQPLADVFNAKILNDCFGIAGWKPPQ